MVQEKIFKEFHHINSLGLGPMDTPDVILLGLAKQFWGKIFENNGRKAPGQGQTTPWGVAVILVM